MFALVSFIILVVDVGAYAAIMFVEAYYEDNVYWPNTVARYVGDSLEQAEDGTWDADSECQKNLESLDEDSWAMLLDDEGAIVWQWHLPSELEHTYSRDDVMAMAHFNAVDEYPHMDVDARRWIHAVFRCAEELVCVLHAVGAR